MINSNSQRLILVFSAFLVFCAGASESNTAPFVASFERFYSETQTVGAGRLLLTELSCTACHNTNDESLQPKRGPVLDGVGGRVNGEWLRQFLNNPHGAKHGTTMPDLLYGMNDEQKKEFVEPLVHLLSSSIKTPWKSRKLPAFSSAVQGATLFHETGCVACHEPDKAYQQLGGVATVSPKFASVPFPGLKQKYDMQGLMNFLLAPLEHRPGGRMPDLKLSVDNAAEITAFLLERESVNSDTAEGIKPLAADSVLVAKGLQIFRTIGCAKCHDLNGIQRSNGVTPGTTTTSRHDSRSRR